MADIKVRDSDVKPVKPTPRPELSELLRQSVETVKCMSSQEYEEMIRLQRESWVRGMGPCEHGVLDFETCAECRSAAKEVRDG